MSNKNRYETVLDMMAAVLPGDAEFLANLTEQIIQRQAGEIRRLRDQVVTLQNRLPTDGVQHRIRG